MAELLSRIGFKGTRKEFREFLLTDPRFIAKRPEEIQERLWSYVRNIEPNIPSYFWHIPKPDNTIQRLQPGLEGRTLSDFMWNHLPGSRLASSSLTDRS